MIQVVTDTSHLNKNVNWLKKGAYSMYTAPLALIRKGIYFADIHAVIMI